MHNKGGTEKAGGYCAARRGHKQVRGYGAARSGHKQGWGVIALMKKTEKHINEHLNAQERGHRQKNFCNFTKNETILSSKD